eukprot:Hpha_TRINITY_DN34467_c0_g1::TRINITY_DN34467_c0_g1_i1::g.96256::m.96256/K10587/UBE3A, E6AP; ubiquitin-protein ligase E3 A
MDGMDIDDDPELLAAIRMSLQTTEDASPPAAASSPIPPPAGVLAPGAEIRTKPPGKNGTYTGKIIAMDDGALTVKFRGIDDAVILPAGHAYEFPIGGGGAAPSTGPPAPVQPPPAPKPARIRPPADVLTLEETERLLSREDPDAVNIAAGKVRAALGTIESAQWLWFDLATHKHQAALPFGFGPGTPLGSQQDLAQTPMQTEPLIQATDWLGRAGSWHMALDEAGDAAQPAPAPDAAKTTTESRRKAPPAPPIGLDLRRGRQLWFELDRSTSQPLLAASLRSLSKQLAEYASGTGSESWQQILTRERSTLRGPAPYVFDGPDGIQEKDATPYLTWRLARLFALLLESPTVYRDVECCGALCLALARLRQFVSPALAHLLAQYRAPALRENLTRLQAFLSDQITNGVPPYPGIAPIQLSVYDVSGDKVRFERGTRLGLSVTFPDGTGAKCKGMYWDPETRMLRAKVVLDKDTGGDRRAETSTSIPLRSTQGKETLENTILQLAAMADSDKVRHNLRSGPHCAAAALAIGVLYDANFLWRAQGILKYEAFYNQEVNDNIDAEVEMHRWHRKRFASDAFKPTEFFFTEAPYLLDPAFKAELLGASARIEQRQQVERGGQQNLFAFFMGGVDAMFLHLRIDRSNTNNLIDSTLRELAVNSSKIRYPLRVHFDGHAGLDAGGLRKEWMQMLQAAIFDPSYGMFTEDPVTRVLWFQPRVLCSDCDRQFNLIGQLLGLALYNGIILDLNFPPVCYKLLLGQQPVFTDLKGLDPVVYNNLEKLLSWDEEVEGASVQDTFGVTFMVTHEVFGVQEIVDLKPGGRDIDVTAENRHEYASLMAQYKCSTSIGKNFDEFRRGFLFVCGDQEFILKMLRSEELERMIVGSNEIDLSQLKLGSRYEGYKPDDATCKHFWELVDEIKDEQTQRKFLRFCSGTDRVPIHGLASYNFTLMRTGEDSEALPCASTCFYVLKLPDYKDKDKLRRKLMQAIAECTGFDLE